MEVASQPAVANAGTLTCTVSDVPSDSKEPIGLSCSFKSHSGVNSDYLGSARTRTGGFPAAKHVFVWSVVALNAGEALLLDGVYRAGPSQQGSAVLVGGQNGALRLEPVTGAERVAGPSEITTLALEVAATKT